MDNDAIIERLRNQVRRAEPVLFVGAGFSRDALNVVGTNLPLGKDLAEAIWKVAFPDKDYDASASLGDIYYAAKLQNPKGLLAVMKDLLTVDGEQVPDHFRVWFSMPWSRCYSLNIDDLELATNRKYPLPRIVISVSATSGRTNGKPDGRHLEVIHLNGSISDDLDDLVFSDLDYARRNTGPDKWYATWSTDIISRPVVFVGTRLNEATLWQYVEFRRRKGGRGISELRPGSYLVSPELDFARRTLLKELHVDWIQMTAEQFATSVLTGLQHEAREGLKLIQTRDQESTLRSAPRLVSDLSANREAPVSAEYLLGKEPTWAELQEGLAIPRECDEELFEVASSILGSDGLSAPLVVTGTAGSGKSTSLMGLGLRLAGKGIATYWLDKRWNIQPHSLRELVAHAEGPIAILVDDADVFGRMASGWAREVTQMRPGVLLGLGVRSNRIDGLLDVQTLGGIDPTEVVMPYLADADIDGLIALLDLHNKLGVLKGMSPAQRVNAFRKQAGRQLLVAMIQATSGRELREKVFGEFVELPDGQRVIYAMACVVHSQRHEIDRGELLVATGAPDNETLNAIETLVRRGLLFRETLYSGYRARHRMIADELANGMEFRPYYGQVLEGLTFAFANAVRPTMPRQAKPWRRLIRFINHDFIRRVVDLEASRACYAKLEDSLHWDYQYWLQRGSLEVEDGDLELAVGYLDQARSLAGGERNVETEYAYLLTKKAWTHPDSPQSHEWFNTGREFLENQIAATGKVDSYPYHVLGSQGLAWARHGNLTALEKRELLGRLVALLKEGVAYHPRSDELNGLKRDLERQWLMMAASG